MRSKKALINIISSIILQMITIISGLIIPRLIIGTYGSGINGLVASITRFLGFITLLEAGFGPVIKASLYKPIAKDDVDTIAKILKSSEKIFRVISYLFIVYILVLCVSLPLVVNSEFSMWFTVSLIVIIAISIFAEYYFGMTYKLFLQAEQKAYIIYLIQICTLLLNTVVVVLLIKLGTSIQVVKLVGSMIFVLRPILQNLYVKKKYDVNFKEVDVNFEIKQKWDGLAQHIAYVINNNINIFLLVICGNMSEVSVYTIYSMIVNSIRNIVYSFTGGIDSLFGDMIAKGEHDKLNISFRVYEGIYFSICTIVFFSTFFLILPFVNVYTKQINDTNYIRPVFGVLMVMTEFIIAIRQPYNDLIKVSGRFKETKIGAWIEVIVNIVTSLVFIGKFGIVGVMIGSLAAVIVRAVEIIYFTSKYILKRKIIYSLKNVIGIFLQFVLVFLCISVIQIIDVNNYITFFISAISVLILNGIIAFLVNMFVHNKSFKLLVKIIKKRRVNIYE